MRFYNGATGLKTGTTSGAGSCLSATASRDGLSLVAVVMGCATSDDRFSSARGLLDFGFANYMSATPPSIQEQLTPIPVLRGTEDQVDVVYDDPGKFVVEKGNEDALVQEITAVDDVQAPVEQGQILGKVEVVVNGEVMGSYDLKAAYAVDKMTLGKAYQRLLGCLLTMKGREKPKPEELVPGDIAEEDPAAGETPAEESAAPAEGESSAEESAPAAQPCACGLDQCKCLETGDVCGCLG